MHTVIVFVKCKVYFIKPNTNTLENTQLLTEQIAAECI